MRLPLALNAFPLLAATLLISAVVAQTPSPTSSLGYFRFPAISRENVVFTAEGDLWRVPIRGGVAQRLTTHASEESHAAISPDGSTIAFSASYEGPIEVYTIPINGGPPVRRTFDGAEGQWLIEGHGVDPDIVVDNEPHATFEGQDAQLDAAIEYLRAEIKAHPVPVPPAPPYPKKALKSAVSASR